MSKVLLILGASSDVGMALIDRLQDKYNLIWAHYCNWNKELDEIQQNFGYKIRFIQADFGDEKAIQALIEKIKESGLVPQHIVHLPSPKAVNQKFLKTDWEAFEQGWKVAFQSAVLTTKAFLGDMKKNKCGKIVFMLSAYVENVPPKYQSPYVSVKYALLGLMKSLAAEYADFGICINAVSPDMMDTKFLDELPSLLIEQYTQNRPQKRIYDVQDIIPYFDFLLSEEANSLNGMNILIH